MAQYNDLFGFQRYAQAQDMARQWERQSQLDALAREQMAQEAQQRGMMNALRLAEFEDNRAAAQGQQQTQNALRFGLGNQPYLETLRDDPALYNEAQAVNRQDMLRYNPQANPVEVAKYGDRMDTPKPEKPGRVQTVTTAEGVFALNPDGSLGKRLGGVPKRSAVTINTGGKPLPPQALKMQQEELDAIGLASSIKTDLGDIRKQVASGKLQLGPITNIGSKAANVAGISTENSRNYAAFMATLEKMRNDSLRLNKGVQTEGDAQRAWNELLANVNDKELVMKRLAQIERINDRAASFRKKNVENIRNNYGQQMLDVSGYEDVPSVMDENGDEIQWDEQ